MQDNLSISGSNYYRTIQYNSIIKQHGTTCNILKPSQKMYVIFSANTIKFYSAELKLQGDEMKFPFALSTYNII